MDPQVQLFEMNILLEQIRHFLGIDYNNGTSLFICGDFNCTPMCQPEEEERGKNESLAAGVLANVLAKKKNMAAVPTPFAPTTATSAPPLLQTHSLPPQAPAPTPHSAYAHPQVHTEEVSI